MRAMVPGEVSLGGFWQSAKLIEKMMMVPGLA